jgi:hypothetical protein
MIENLYLMEMTVKWKQQDIARGVEHVRRTSIAGGQPSPVRRAVASAIVRFGIFLNGSAYHCPDATVHSS